MTRSPKNFSGGLDDIKGWEHALSNFSEDVWLDRGEKAVVSLFHQMARRVPAYRDFLKKNGIRHEKIVSVADLKNVPTIDKSNYLRMYSLDDLSWDGRFADTHAIISSTSGSTGEPMYFPRTRTQDLQYALFAELYLRENFSVQKKSTLYINAFPLGVWIGGLFTYAAIEEVARRGKYRLSLINPGIDKDAIIRIVKKFSKDFDQIIIGSYGPFLKDILDMGALAGIDWKKINTGFVFSAEGFSEKFRDYVTQRTAFPDKLRATLNHYGTVDLGTMSYETPFAILARQQILEKSSLRMDVFGERFKVPTVTQYIPEIFYFENDHHDSIIASANAGLPLVRYDLKDRGRVYTLKNLRASFRANSVDIDDLVKENHLSKSVWQLPFVHVFERLDLSVSYYAFLVFPETIRRAIVCRAFSRILTGRLTLVRSENRKLNQVLEIHVEMMPGVQRISDAERRRVGEAIHNQLYRESSEYKHTFTEKGDNVRPKIIIWPFQDKKYFATKGKHQWVVRDASQIKS